MSELDTLISNVQAHPTNWKLQKDLLKQLRQSKQRKSDLVLKYGESLLENHAGSLGSEVWDVYEQVTLGALDCGKTNLALSYINKLNKQFPQSLRVQRLKGMLLEAEGRWKEADIIYRQMLELDPTDAMVMKRQIAIQKGMGNLEAACTMLDTYLTVFMADTEAWLELTQLRTTLGQYAQAAAGCEELILAYPMSHAHHTRYAELLYTMGGAENFKLARKYFAHSLELNSASNARALWGLSATTLAQATVKGGKSSKEDGLTEWAEEKILQMYTNSDKLPIVRATLKKLNVT